MRQLPLALSLAPPPGFDNFAAGANQQLLQALREIACRALQPPSSTAAPPLYMWGPAGSGKTHLLRALQRQVLGAAGSEPFPAAPDAAAPVAYLDAAMPQPWPWSAQWRVLLLDQCEQLDAAAQQAAFALFVEAAGSGAQIVAAGRLPPVDLPLREDLKTRLGWGLVQALQPLGEDDTRTLLAVQARARGLALPQEMIAYMLTRLPREPGFLLRLLDALDAYALAQGRALTLPLLRELLASEPLLAAQPPTRPLDEPLPAVSDTR